VGSFSHSLCVFGVPEVGFFSHSLFVLGVHEVGCFGPSMSVFVSTDRIFSHAALVWVIAQLDFALPVMFAVGIPSMVRVSGRS
jgi:hypothetical protein